MRNRRKNRHYALVSSVDDLGRNLIENLRLLVDEQAALWEAPQESSIVSEGSTVRSGPWDVARCSEVLGRWLRAGFISLYRYEGAEIRDLAPDEAILAVERWEQWRPGEPNVFLYLTKVGAEVGHDQWIEIADRK